jgi:hypothetical protein
MKSVNIAELKNRLSQLDVNFSRHLGMRATADYRSLVGIGTASGEKASQLWLRTGLVVSFGTR